MAHFTAHPNYRSYKSFSCVSDPPEKADITGPYTVEKDSSFNLTCNTDSNPPAEYWWKHDLSSDTPIIARGNECFCLYLEKSFHCLFACLLICFPAYM